MLQRHTSLRTMEGLCSFCFHRKWMMYSLQLLLPSLLWMSFSVVPMWAPTSGFSWANVTWAVQWLVILVTAEIAIFIAVCAFTQDEDDVYITWREPVAYLVLCLTVTVLVPQALDMFPIPYFAPVTASLLWSCAAVVMARRFVRLKLAQKVQSVRADETLSRPERHEELAFLLNPLTKRRVLRAFLYLVQLLGWYVALGLGPCHVLGCCLSAVCEKGLTPVLCVVVLVVVCGVQLLPRLLCLLACL